MPVLGAAISPLPISPAATSKALRVMAPVDDGTLRDYSSPNAWAPNAAAPLTTPTYDGSGQIAELDVLYFPQGWNGYRYWMANGPYPGGNSGYENPSLLVSQDGKTWSVPPGVTNPLEPMPAGHNSDPSLFCDVNGTMYLFWMETDGAGDTTLRYRTSIDSVTWTPTAVWFDTGVGPGGDSPTIIYDGVQYYMFNHAIPTGQTFRQLYYSTASTVSGLTNPTTPCTGLGIQSPASVNWSHFNIKYHHGRWYLLYSDTQNLYLCTSLDGIAWTVNPKPALRQGPAGAWDSAGIYRTSFVIAQTAQGPALDCWYASHNGATPDVWRIGYTRMLLNGGPQTTLTGTTAGTALWSQPYTAPSFKKVLVRLAGYQNSTATAQTVTFPTPFVNAPYLAKDDSGGATASTTTLTLPASMGATVTGWVVVEGF